MAKQFIKVTGTKRVRQKLFRGISGIRGNLREGLEKAGELVKGKSEDLTSIDTSVLIKSTFNTPEGTNKKPSQIIGYEADYAAHVHEMPESTNWQRPGAENEFLEKAVIRNVSSILNLIVRLSGRKIL